MKFNCPEENQSTHGEAAFSWIETVVAIVVICVLASFALPSITVGPVRGVGTQTLSNMKQLHMATEAMVQDGEITRNKSLGWPGETGGTFTNWSAQLVPAYLAGSNFCKLLSAPGKQVPIGKLPASMSASAILVYAVGADSPDHALFLSTANFTNGPQGGNALESSAQPTTSVSCCPPRGRPLEKARFL